MEKAIEIWIFYFLFYFFGGGGGGGMENLAKLS